MSRMNIFDIRRNFNRGDNKEKTYYKLIDDLGMTFGSAVANFTEWLKNDIKQFTDLKHTYIDSQFAGMYEFQFTEAMLMQVDKPNLSIQYSIDHTQENQYMTHPSLKNMEGMNFLRPTMYMESLIRADDSENDVDIRISYKPIKIIVNVGIVTYSRYHADNIAHAWNVRRSDEYMYSTKMLLDFQIPDYIIEMLYEKYNIKRNNHRYMLKWLNKHCFYPVFYGMNTYNGKNYFFINLKVKPTIRVNGLDNPRSISETTTLTELWTLSRSFELDILIPTVLGITGYRHPELKTMDKEEKIDEEIIASLRKDRIAEYNLQIDDKHALVDMKITLDDTDMVTLKSGKVISKKIDVGHIIENEGVGVLFKQWITSKGWTLDKAFDFVVMKNLANTPYTRIGKGHSISEAMEKLGMTLEEYKNFTSEYGLLIKNDDNRFLTIDDLDIPDEDAEYDNYIKNTQDFWFIDLTPDETSREYRITVYCSIRLFNQFVMETGYTREEFIYQDDMAHEYPQGKDITLNDIQKRY